ncbi:hypothetical protein FACS189459_7230 [Bacilli bacterium]|nr:hypothetical protein FACS189459_7230 [Bacilli bacterium]
MNESLKVSISCQNHVRREIAALALKRIIKGGHADFEYVDRIKKEETEEFDRICTEIGKDVIENKLKFFDVNHSIYRIVGQMQYRKSYGQNILEHMVECAQICALLARQFGYDEYIARKTGFFHDIGKSTDYNAEHDHVANGIEIAKKYNLGNDVIEVIRGHHEHTKTENTYLKFAKIADTISASRPGARHGQNEDFKTKSKEINLLKEKFHEINKIIINKSGRELVIVLNCTDETDLETLEFNINNTICANDKLNKFPINITIIHNIAE